MSRDTSGEKNPCYGKIMYNDGNRNFFLREDEVSNYPNAIRGRLKVSTNGQCVTNTVEHK